MRTTITKRLDNAKGKVRAKGAKPNYRDRFAEEADDFDRGGTRGKCTLAEAVKIYPLLIERLRDDKQTALRVFVSKIRDCLLQIEGYQYSFKHGLQEFAKANALTPQQAQEVFEMVQDQASDRLEMTKNRLLKAEPTLTRESSGTAEKQTANWYLTFRTFLPTVAPQPWKTYFKRLKLDPVEREAETGQ